MQDRSPASLGDRLGVVAVVCGSAAAVVLVTNLVFALVTDTSSGAVASPVRQRLVQVAHPADVTLGVVVLVGATAVALGRWFDGGRPAGPDRIGTLVAVTSATVAVLAVAGLFADLLWRFDGAVWGWRVAAVGQRTAAGALGGLALWLARPATGHRSRPAQ